MRRTILCSRGSKGYGWYSHFLKNGGNEGFKNTKPPTPFDWNTTPGIYAVGYYYLIYSFFEVNVSFSRQI